jgi:predicted nucleic acid-binding protein
MASPPDHLTPEELTERLRGVRFYLDANVFIYAFDGGIAWEPLRHLLSLLRGGQLRAVTSELSLAETLVWPIRNRDRVAQAAFSEAIQNSAGLIVHPVSRAVLLEAARLRALHPLEMPDAIHAATAKLSNCRAFLTGDAALAAAINLPAWNVERWRTNV